MKKIPILFFAIMIAGCNFNDDLEYRIDEPLKPHVEAFFEEAAQRGIILEKINLRAIYAPNTYGACPSDAWGVSKRHGDQRVIFIPEDPWLMEEPSALEQLVFHELGHALLYRGHTNEFSIMREAMILTAYEDDPELRKTLLDELFKPYK